MEEEQIGEVEAGCETPGKIARPARSAVVDDVPQGQRLRRVVADLPDGDG
jgi:hypothetical protein